MLLHSHAFILTSMITGSFILDILQMPPKISTTPLAIKSWAEDGTLGSRLLTFAFVFSTTELTVGLVLTVSTATFHNLCTSMMVIIMLVTMHMTTKIPMPTIYFLYFFREPSVF